MSFQEKSIVCSDCGVSFIFSVEDQEYFQSKGFTNEPKRCPSCRQAKKQNAMVKEMTATEHKEKCSP